MVEGYTLETKIHALDMIDQSGGSLLLTSERLSIPRGTLTRWRAKEDVLRREYQQKLKRQFFRLKDDLQVAMLDKGMQIMTYMDDDKLKDAPLNQLATALSALVNHALKLEEATGDTDEQGEKIVRFEYYYDGEVQDAPPWTGASQGQPRAVQGGRMRQTMGKNGTGKNHPDGEHTPTWDTWLVVNPDFADVEPTVEGAEDDSKERDWYHD